MFHLPGSLILFNPWLAGFGFVIAWGYGISRLGAGSVTSWLLLVPATLWFLEAGFDITDQDPTDILTIVVYAAPIVFLLPWVLMLVDAKMHPR